MMKPANPLPREVAPGVHWLGVCIEQSYRGQPLHGYNSVYLVSGSESSALVEAGHPPDLRVIAAQLAGLLANGAPPVRYVFTTHQETPHSSGVGVILGKYPEAVLCGDTTDLHLAFPSFVDRFRSMGIGADIHLGGRKLRLLEGVFRDYPTTLWAFDTAEHVLFAGDGFAYSHYHQDGHCGQVAEEAGSLNIPEMTALFAELAFYWTRFVDIEPYIARLDRLIVEHEVQIIAPTHGLPIIDPAATLPEVREGLRLGSRESRGEVF